MTVAARGVVGLIGAVALVLAGCGDSDDGSASGDSAGAEVLPFEQVQADEFVFENDPTDPGRAIFRVTTTEPMICAIVWGETEALGNFNNSLSMNGTGIVAHDVILPGAVAGQTYYFQVQGSTADGRLYSSPLATFTLPEADADDSAGPAPVDAELGPNLALGATIVEQSSEFSPDWSGSNAVDGDLATEWATAADGDDGFIVIDLGSSQAFAGVQFVTRSMADGSAITDRFTVTVDDAETFGPFDAGTVADPGFADVPADGQVLRFDIESSSGGNTGAVEIRVLAPADGDSG